MGAGKGFLCVVLPERKRPAATALRKSRQQRAPKSASPGGKRKSQPEKYRVIIILYYVEGFKIREIGEILHESESAVKRRLASARKQMELAYYPEKRRNAE